MDWAIFWRKMGRGMLVAAALGGITALTVALADAAKRPDAPVWFAAAAPILLHLLGMAQNWAKHKNDHPSPPP